MESAVTMTTDYLRTRKQFGVPLAAFQALTHRAADMYVSLELARSTAMYLAMSVAEGDTDPALTYPSVVSTIRCYAITSGDLEGSTYVEYTGNFSSDADAGKPWTLQTTQSRITIILT